LPWTSPESRCHRQLGKRFGDQAYAIEELVAELGAAFLCADLRITDEPRADHAQYLASWLAKIRTLIVAFANRCHADASATAAVSALPDDVRAGD
jgi:antirestriction protein ArdC